MPERYLIVNADDFGLNHATNQAIEELFDAGRITSTTLMPCAPWAVDGILRAKANPRMNVGLHLTLTAEWRGVKWGPVSRRPVPSLLDDNGYFYARCADLLKKATAEDVVAEMDAQLDWMLKFGYKPTHMDNHMGSVYGIEGPTYLPQVFALCAKHGLPFRFPRDAGGMSLPPEAAATLPQITGLADVLGVKILSALVSFPRRITAEDTYESVKAGYIGVIRALKPGVNEIYMHPAKESDEMKATTPAWIMREWERRVLLDTDFAKAIASEGVILTTWKDAPFQ